MPDGRLTMVWESIALGASLGLAPRFGTERSVTHYGIAVDVDGVEGTSSQRDPPTGCPRRGRRRHRRQMPAIRDVQTKPADGPPFTFAGHLIELINSSPITFFDMIPNSGETTSRPRASSRCRGEQHTPRSQEPPHQTLGYPDVSDQAPGNGHADDALPTPSTKDRPPL